MVFDWLFGERRTYPDRPRQHDWSSIQPILSSPELQTHREVEDMSNDSTGYQVGVTNDGRTTLRVGDATAITLTMNEVATRQLIRLLEATLPKCDFEEYAEETK